MVNSSFRYPDRIGDHLQRSPADTVFGEQIQRGIKDPRPGGAVCHDPHFPVEAVVCDGLPERSHVMRLADRLDLG